MSDVTTAPAPQIAQAARHLSGPQKAAIIMRLLVRDGVSISLTDLPERQQASLIREISALGDIDRSTIAAVAQEFAQRLAEAGGLRVDSVDEAISLLGGSVSEGAAERVRRGGSDAPHDPWRTIREAERDALVPILEAESAEVAAVILCAMDVSDAAGLLGELPGDRARRIAYAVSLVSRASSDAVRRIGEAVSEALTTSGPKQRDDTPSERIGAILNFSRAKTRDSVLDGLEEEDADLAEEVRRSIFTFAHIPERVDPKDIPKLTRAVPQDRLVVALKFAGSEHPEVRKFILGAMTQRMGDQLTEQIDEAPDVDEDEGDAALTDVTAAIRRMADEGEITLVRPDPA